MFSNFDIVESQHQLCINKWRERCGDNVLTCLKITIVLTKSLSVEEIENECNWRCLHWILIYFAVKTGELKTHVIMNPRHSSKTVFHQESRHNTDFTLHQPRPAQAAAVSCADSHSFLASTSHVWRHGTRDTCSCQQGRDHSHQSPLTRRKDCSCETFLQFYF